MSNLKTRAITGAGLVAVMIAAILISKYTFFLFFAALIMLGLWEFYAAFSAVGKSPQRISGIVIGLLLFVTMFLHANGYDYNESILMVLAIVGVLWVFISEMWRNTENPIENIAITIMGLIYVAVPISLFWPIAYRENIYQYNPNLILGYFILIWAYDSMAYLTGVKFGKHKLFERISPKKSWEGAIGGYIFVLIAGYTLSVFYTELTMWQWLVVASLTAIFGTIGDLTESMFKRSVNIKDSGSILPGHGGLLDRFDALFLAVPAIYLYLQFI